MKKLVPLLLMIAAPMMAPALADEPVVNMVRVAFVTDDEETPVRKRRADD